jgi:putative PIN family toxin of toxin-antitoxin system
VDPREEKETLMLVLLDSNIYFSALISPQGRPAQIIHAWRNGRFRLLTCQEQIDEIRDASRHPRFRSLFHPHEIGAMLNRLYAATVWPAPIPREHVAADPTDSFLLNLAAAAEAHYLVTGDKRSQILALKKICATSILTPREFCEQVLQV